MLWRTPCKVWAGVMSRQGATEPKRGAKAARGGSGADDLARVVARLTASEVHPTPPEAPVIVTICGPRVLEPDAWASPRGWIRRLTDSSRSCASVGRGRNS